ncbi:MAG: hypothetical protein V4590_11690 [Bacteroidota bacterium]
MKQLLTSIFLFFCMQPISFGQTSDQTDKLLPMDFKEIFQLAINLQQLQQYYHIDSDTSRRQIVFQFFGNANHNKLNGVIKFGRQVIIMTEDEIKQRQIKSYFVVGDWVCGTNSVRLQLEYPIEGLLVSYMFKKTNGNWAIAHSNLAEH